MKEAQEAELPPKGEGVAHFAAKIARKRKGKRSAGTAAAASDSSANLQSSSRGSSVPTDSRRSGSSSVSTRRTVSLGSSATGTSEETRATKESSRGSSYPKGSSRNPQDSKDFSGTPGSPHQLWKKFNQYSLSSPGRVRRGHISLLQLFNWFMCAELLDGRVLSPTHLALVFNEARQRSLSLLQFDTLLSLLSSRRYLNESVLRQRLEDAPKPKEAKEMKCKLQSMMFYESAPPTPSTLSVAEEAGEGSRVSDAGAKERESVSGSGESKSQEDDSDAEDKRKKKKQKKKNSRRKSADNGSEGKAGSKSSKSASVGSKAEPSDKKKSKGRRTRRGSSIKEEGKSKKNKKKAKKKND